MALTPTLNFMDILERAQSQARDVGDSLEGTVDMELNGHALRMAATGAKGGFRFRLECDDFLIFIGSPRREWTISVRYLSAGLWEHGWSKLRERAFAVLALHTTRQSDDCVRVSRADWCFDFYSPAFTREFVPGLMSNVVCHASAKAHEAGGYDMWGRAGHGETLTIGSKAGLQNQLYDKTREIDEASGKTWLYDVWAAGMDGEWPWAGKPRDMWRLECRLSGDFLKERNIRRPAEVEAALPSLIAEALFTRRLTVPLPDDDNRSRWPLHPIFSEAYRARGADRMVPVGRKVTGRRRELRERAISQIAGSIRSAVVLALGEYKDATAREFAGEAWGRVTKDAKHHKKETAAQSRYADVEEAR